MRKLVFYPDKCTGCAICTMACVISHANGNVLDFRASRIRVINNKQKIIQVVSVCYQCEEAYCISTCPTGALLRDESLGFIRVNKDLCISCGSCVEACPYKGVILSSTDVKPIICDLCGGDPVCVKWCPFDAIRYIDVDEKSLPEIKKLRQQVVDLLRKALE